MWCVGMQGNAGMRPCPWHLPTGCSWGCLLSDAVHLSQERELARQAAQLAKDAAEADVRGREAAKQLGQVRQALVPACWSAHAWW